MTPEEKIMETLLQGKNPIHENKELFEEQLANDKEV
jgi:hypothetical protein